MSAAASRTHDAVMSGEYELAALRLIYGLLVAVEESAPDAREALLDELAGRRRGRR